MTDLLVIVPTRGRPASVARIARAWADTGAPAHADLLLAVDDDDPHLPEYLTAVDEVGVSWLRAQQCGKWRPMVPKLNAAAVSNAPRYAAVGFAGDDHIPRTPGWAGMYLQELRRLRVGIVYGDDGRWGGALCTEWAMSSAIITRLQRMVPAGVEHLYSDNSVMELGRDASCLSYLPYVVIEHMHPAAGKGQWDNGYRSVNSTEQYAHDQVAFMRWRRHVRPRQVAAVRVLRAAAAGAR